MTGTWHVQYASLVSVDGLRILVDGRVSGFVVGGWGVGGECGFRGWGLGVGGYELGLRD